MDDLKLVKLLKNSATFKNYFPEPLQEKILSRIPNLAPEQKLTIVRILVKESQESQTRDEKKARILNKFQDDLQDLINSAKKEAVSLVEKSEQKTALDDIGARLANTN